MTIRAYRPADCVALTRLFYDTVHTVNARDYSVEQLDAWANGRPDLPAWDRSLQTHISLVAVDGKTILGFGDIDRTGYLDRLYVHADHQGQGIATALCERLEAAVTRDITVHASLTAKPFFEKRGYQARKAQQVERQGVLLTNFVMVKRR